MGLQHAPTCTREPWRGHECRWQRLGWYAASDTVASWWSVYCDHCGATRSYLYLRTAAAIARDLLSTSDLIPEHVAAALRDHGVSAARVADLVPAARPVIGEDGEAQYRGIYGDRWDGGRVPGVDPARVGEG